MGLVLDSTFDKLATVVHRFHLVLPKGQHLSCRESSLLRYQLYGYSSYKTRLLESKGNSLQKLLSPLMPVSLLLQLSDLVFASDAVIGGIICIMGVFLMTL